MRGQLLIAVLLLVLVFEGLGQSSKKYDLKSGIVTFETAVTMMGKTFTKKEIVYFDDYGLKECKESYDGTKLEEAYFNDGKSIYNVIFDEKTAYKSRRVNHGTEMRFDWESVPETEKRSGKAKKLPVMTISGRQCDAYQHEENGELAIYAGWMRLTLYTKIVSKQLQSTAQAVGVQENVRVLPSKFAVPAGFTIK